MGIQGFGTRMRPYAKRIIIGSTDSPVKDSVAIIDGPGLAHYAYYSLCHKRSNSSKAISYAECADAVKKWLDFTCELGFEM